MRSATVLVRGMQRYCQYYCHSCQGAVRVWTPTLLVRSPAIQPGGDEYTIDELAARTGMTVRTVRFYATEGLLPPPTRRGRVGYYGPAHRMRLELIRTLQEHGYTLAAIERVLTRIPADSPPAL